MKNSDKLISNNLKKIALNLDWYTNVLYSSVCPHEKMIVLNKLKTNIQELFSLSDIVLNEALDSSILFRQNQTFTMDQLARYNGKNGNPAYVAVQGVVYDVTNNATWAAATHFGLTAGRDLTSEFVSCHPGQTVLSSLNVVGRLV